MNIKYTPLSEGICTFHIDTTFVFVGEGKVLLNPTRVNENNIPEFLKPFDKIWSPDMIITNVLEDWCSCITLVGNEHFTN